VVSPASRAGGRWRVVAAALVAGAATLTLVPHGPAAAQPARPLDVGTIEVGDHPRLRTVLTPPPELAGDDLDAGTVSVTEGGEEREVALTPLPGDDLEVVLVLDTSGSMRGEAFDAAVAAAASFVDDLPDDARVALVAFGTEPVLAQPRTDDHAAVADALDGLEAAGETALHDAVVLAAEQLSDDDGALRALVVLSDGGDTTSERTEDAAVAAVTASGARLDAVELVTDERDPDALARLAAAGRGTVASADDPAALGAVYDDLAASLGNAYELTWTSGSAGSTEVTVRLEAAGLVAERTRTVDLPEPPPGAASVGGDAAAGAAEPVVAPGPRRTATLLAVGLTCAALALLLVGLVVLVPDPHRRRLDRLGAARSAITAGGPGALRTWQEVSGRAADAVEDALTRHGRRSGLDALLEQSGVALRTGEWVVLTATGAVLGFVVGWLALDLLAGVLLAAAIAVGAYLVLGMRRDRRRRAFAEQLSEALPLLAGSLRAGYGLLQGIDALSREAPEPTRGELRRVVVETRLGRDLSQSLDALADRMAAEDFRWVVQAIAINREVGGDLAELLDTAAATIRERNQVQRQVRTLTAEGRLSAWILLALPIGLAAAMRLVSPEYFRLLTYGPGLVLAAVGTVSLVIGWLWVRALSRLDV
jgi:tight adherence protein B